MSFSVYPLVPYVSYGTALISSFTRNSDDKMIAVTRDILSHTDFLMKFLLITI